MVKNMTKDIAGVICIAGIFGLMFLCIILPDPATATDAPEAVRTHIEKKLPPVEFFIEEPEVSSEEVVSEAMETVSEIVLYDVPLSSELQQHVIKESEQYGINPVFIFGIIERETGYRANAVGDSGKSEGLMQIQRKWHSGRMEELGCTDLLDPYQNVTVGVNILAEQLDRYDGDMAKALTAYNQGHYKGTVTKYAKGVMEIAARLEGGVESGVNS